MNARKASRQSSSAPDGIIGLGAPVLVRRAPNEPEFHARVVARTFGLPLFDVETADGEVIKGLTLVRLDETALAIRRAIDALDSDQRPVFIRNCHTSRKQPENTPFARQDTSENR